MMAKTESYRKLKQYDPHDRLFFSTIKIYSEKSKPGMNVNTLVIEQSDAELQKDFGALADESMPNEFSNWVGLSDVIRLSVHCLPQV